MGTFQFCSFSMVFNCVVPENINIHPKEGHFFDAKGEGCLITQNLQGRVW
jgi:hypothetical protein